MNQVRDRELRDFFIYVIEVLENNDIPYMVVGGFAAIFYGEPRLTIDVDIVADMQSRHVKPFIASFASPDYYASEEGIRDQTRTRRKLPCFSPCRLRRELSRTIGGFLIGFRQ